MKHKIVKYFLIFLGVSLGLLAATMIYFYLQSLEEQKLQDQKELSAVFGIELEPRSAVEQLGNDELDSGGYVDFFEFNDKDFAKIQSIVADSLQLPFWDQIYHQFLKDYKTAPWKKGKLSEQGLPLHLCNGFLSNGERQEDSELMTELETVARQSDLYFASSVLRDTPTEYIHVYILWPERKMLMRCVGTR